jgi:hypothetical protein
MKESFDIGITTFSLRLDLVETLIRQIRGFGIQNRIILCINGEKNGKFDKEYRKKILNICLEYDEIYPIFFIETRGLSKMWNTILNHSVLDNIFMLNDDLDIQTDEVFNMVYDHIRSSSYFGLTKVNNTWSYFIVNKKYIDSIGYFDERLLGFGEEDGDMEYRSMVKSGKSIGVITSTGIYNIISKIRHTHIRPGIDKYSYFNRDFIYNKKYKFGNSTSKIRGMFDLDCDPILQTPSVYPYESFFMINKNKL